MYVMTCANLQSDFYLHHERCKKSFHIARRATYTLYVPQCNSGDDRAAPYCSLPPRGTPIPLDWVRREFTTRWPVSARVVEGCRVTGILVALVSIGFPPVWLILFPFAMTGTVTLMRRWGWLAPTADKWQGRGLVFLLSAPFCILLLPFVYYLLLIAQASIFGLLLFVYVRLTGAAIPPRTQENLSFLGAMIVIAIGWELMYWALHALALRRLTRAWYRSLFWQMVAWTSVSIGFAIFVTSRVDWVNMPVRQSPLWPVVTEWILNLFIVSQLGALFGRWLARPAPLPISENTVISL